MFDFLTLMTLWTETRVWNDLLFREANRNPTPLKHLEVKWTLRDDDEEAAGLLQKLQCWDIQWYSYSTWCMWKNVIHLQQRGQIGFWVLMNPPDELVKHDDEMQHLFILFVASETHPSPEISHFFTKPTWTTGCFYSCLLKSSGLGCQQRDRFIPRFHKSLPWFEKTPFAKHLCMEWYTHRMCRYRYVNVWVYVYVLVP